MEPTISGSDGDALEDDLWSTLSRCRTRQATRFVINAVAGLRTWLRSLEKRIASGEEALKSAELS